MNVEWFESFLETARSRSLSKAAEKLNITQPALSKQIRRLEEAVGARLLRRSSSGVELTEAGRLLQERIPAVLDELQAIFSEAGQFGTRQKIAFGTLPSLAAYYLPQKVIRLQQQRRPVLLDVHVLGTSEELVRALHQGRLEAALVESKYAKPPLWGKELFAEPYYAILPLRHPLSGRASLRVGEIGGETLVVHPEPCDVRQSILRAFRAQGLEPRIGMEVDGEFVLDYAAAGAGIAIVPETNARHLGERRLTAVPVADFGAARGISLAARHRRTGERLARLLAEAAASPDAAVPAEEIG
jgi:DNA-binding transcriptional LysR family regulator